MSELKPGAQKIIMHVMGGRDLGKYLRGEEINPGNNAPVRRPVEPGWNLVSIYQEQTGEDPWPGGKTYLYRVIWSEKQTVIREIDRSHG